MLAEINIKRNSFDIPVLNGLDKGIRKYWFLLQPVIAVFAGWMSFQSNVLNYPIYESQRFIAAIVLLCWVWRSVKTKKAAWLTLFGWYLGAASSIPSEWQVFFGNSWGWLGMIAFAAIAAIPVFVVPQRWIKFGLIPATFITALSPIGMLTPWMAAFAFFPGFGWVGLFLSLVIQGLPAIKTEKDMVAVLIALCFIGTVLNTNPKYSSTSPTAWGIQTYDGNKNNYIRQQNIQLAVRSNLTVGANLLLTPEGTVDDWGAYSKTIWQHIPVPDQSQVFIGAYLATPQGHQDGLVDISTGEFYPNTMPMIIGMWHPWSKEDHYPINLSSLTQTIQTKHGKAAYLICYEELLLWPLAGKMFMGHPNIILSAANQWFTTRKTDIAQARSISLQSRLWGLPLVRAVNYRK